jgi:hypothetical protein
MKNISKILENKDLVASIQMHCDIYSAGSLTVEKFLQSYSEYLNGKAMNCWIERMILDMYAYTLELSNKSTSDLSNNELSNLLGGTRIDSTQYHEIVYELNSRNYFV